MPTKRIFDMVLLTALLVTPATGLVRLAARRWASEDAGIKSSIGASLAVAI